MNQNKAMVGLSTYESFIEFADDDGSSLNYSVDHPIRFGEPNKTTVFLFRFNAQSIFCLICVDALWVSNAIADEVRHRISKDRLVPIENISIAASHTHGAPNCDRHFTFSSGSTSYENKLKAVIFRAVDHAFNQDFENVFVDLIRADLSDVAINRRRNALFVSKSKISCRVQNLPNFRVGGTFSAQKLEFRSVLTGQIKSVLVNFACHPVSDPPSMVGSDFPGHMRRLFKEKHGDQMHFGFLQGFSGDIRPKLIFRPSSLKDWCLELIIGSRFRPSQNGDSQKIAEQIIDQLESDDADRNELKFFDNIRSKREKKEIQLDNGKSHSTKFDLTFWQIGNLHFKFLSGEILSGFSNLNTGSAYNFEVGCANGMVGYIPSMTDCLLGGYEVDGSRSRFKISDRISRSFSKMLLIKLSKGIY